VQRPHRYASDVQGWHGGASLYPQCTRPGEIGVLAASLVEAGHALFLTCSGRAARPRFPDEKSPRPPAILGKRHPRYKIAGVPRSAPHPSTGTSHTRNGCLEMTAWIVRIYKPPVHRLRFRIRCHNVSVWQDSDHADH
jgi:hypothetical protein